MSNTPANPPDDGRHLCVVRGDPTPEEVAALVAVLTARARRAHGTGAGTGQARRGQWRNPERLLRRPPTPGPGAWRASFHPG
ncbi:acyl-CoA carboxylase epsilon subunit-like protein [Haloactinospora alba]|uniref:Acyl-CoA carboxylase epsilon subunit-like protein n=1 Tax=Haloactinospora alba TaxID=405555 RepID=A0A543NEW4_9ACTN|nr:acyl-CoA carboxylase subunit epsilon [Haloactinospora alba]TQN30356.1 acyl-CoA carboxylase epsilon subunit-like protein [Haloactinospora alba]